MPQQPPPQNPQPDRPAETSPTPDSSGGYPQQQGLPPQSANGPTPPGGTPGYARVNGYGPAPVPGRSSASGGYGAVGAPGRAGAYPPGPPPGHGPPPPSWRPAPPAAPTQAMTASTAGVTTAVAAAAEAKKKDLTVNKLIAGAGAAATSAVLGSFFGALGTVGGAAIGSVFSAVITSLYQHSLDKTRDTVKAKVKLPGGKTVKVSATTEVPAPRGAADQASTRVFVTPGDQPTELISAVPAVDAGPPKSRRRLLVMTGFTVVVFAIGMLAITGIELVKGSPLNTSSSSTSERSGGTSLGTVLGSGSAATETSSETATTSETEPVEPTSEATPSEDASDGEDADSSAEPGTRFGADDDESSRPSGRATPTPTPTPDSGADAQSDQDSRTGGGAARQPDGGAAEPDSQQ